MGKPFTQLYAHLVWATWDRLPLITPTNEPALYACLLREALDLDCELLAIGGIEDHVHLVVRMPPTLCISDLVKQLKGNSSHLANQVLAPSDGFKWQGYYGAFSVSRSDLKRVVNYVLQQKERHANRSIWSEAEKTGWKDSE